jgi:hypothetical protein
MHARAPAGIGAQAGTLTVGEVLRFGLGQYAGENRLPAQHWKVLNALMACRTAALGGQRYQCESCGREHFVFHSCRNRHCPTCQGANSLDWLARQEQVILPIAYFHLVFTLPHVLNPLIRQNQALLYALLFESTNATLLEFGRNNLGVQLGITAVLHTWSQTLLDHYHLHSIVSGGGICLDGSGWKSSSGKYLFAVQALSEVFRAKFRDGLWRLYEAQRLTLEGQLQGLRDLPAFTQLMSQALTSQWVVYSKRPFAGPQQVLAYLSRYTHRVGLSNRRLLELDKTQGTVRFNWRDYAQDGAQKTMTLGLDEFIRRLCLHFLPPQFVKIRHYGFLSNRHRRAKVEQARQLLAMSLTDGRAVELEPRAAAHPEEPKRVCPFCGKRRLVLVQTVGPLRHSAPLILDSS